MKKIFALLVLLVGGRVVQAQSPYEASTAVQTALAVDVTIRTEQVVAGPYARYAQRLLGLRPALSDRRTHSIEHAAIALLPAKDGGEQTAQKPEDRSYTDGYDASGAEFARLTPDRLDAQELTEQAAAQRAAAQIFSLRRHRLDLITGEAGEHVFGAGLKTALERIDAMEQELLELFLGRRQVLISTTRVPLLPEGSRAVVGYFSPEVGFSAVPAQGTEEILISYDPQPISRTGVKPSSKTVDLHLAADTFCTLTWGGRQLVSARLPIFQFGRTIAVNR